MIKTIQEICTVVRGSSPRPQGDPQYYGGKIPRLMVADLSRDGMYVTPRIDSLTEEGALKSRPMKRGELVIAVSGNPGEPCILSIDACIHDGFVGLRDLDEKTVFPPYLYQYLKFIKETNKAQAVGAIYKNLNTDQIKSFQIPLPPLSIQKKIAAILDAADEYRQKTKTLIEKYDQLAQSLFLDMFGKNSGKSISFNDIADKSNKGTFSNGPFGSDLLTSELTNNGVPVIYIRDLKNGQFTWKSNVYVTYEKAEELKNCQVNFNDVLIAKVGDPPGITALYSGKDELAVITQDVIRLRVNTKIVSPKFIQFWFNSQIGQVSLKPIIVEGTRKRFGLGDLKKTKINVPPITIQNQFAERIQLIEAQKQQAQASLLKAEDLFNSLLQRAFKGELT